MKPEKGKPYVDIPIAVDVNTTTINTFKTKALWIVMILGVFLVSEIPILLLASWVNKFLFSFISFLIALTLIRYIVLKERHYKKLRNQLIEMNYTLPLAKAWGILDISDKFPYICRFTDGSKAIFVQLQKGIKIGRPDDFQFENSEYIGEAYKEMEKCGMSCVHIDYMDVTGKDTRMVGIFNQVEETENPYLKRLLLEKFSYIEQLMNKVYSTYDVYAFYSNESDDKFWDDLQDVIEVFMNANYISAKILNKDDLADLVKVVLNMNNFSVNQAVETIYKANNQRKRIKVIWTENNGVREVHNQTKEELEQQKLDSKRKKVKKKSKVKKSFTKKSTVPTSTAKSNSKKETNNDDEINLFD